jgi:hypothetical protein
MPLRRYAERNLSSGHDGWVEGSCVKSRRFHEAVLRVIGSSSYLALCHYKRSGYQPFPLVYNLDGWQGSGYTNADRRW